MKKTAILTLPALAVFAVGTASAAVVTPVGISAFHQGDSLAGDGSSLRAIDGSGMNLADPADPSTWTVSSTAWQDDWQGFQAPGTPNNTWAILDLGGPTADLAQMYLWNVHENAPGNQATRGMDSFNIYYSLSPSVPAPATSGTVTPYDFSSGGWTLIGGANLAASIGVGDTGAAFDVSPAAGAQYIGIEILSNHGDGARVGFGEVAFTTIPEPGSISLLVAGGLLGLLRRRRR